MPTNITDSSAFTDPIQAPADADPQAASSYALGYQGLANRTRYLKNLFAPAVLARTWLSLNAAAWNAVASDWTFDGSTQKATSAADSARRFYPISKLPKGATIQSVTATVVPGEARATSGNRIKVQLRSHNQAAGDAAIGSSVRDDGTAASQDVTQSSIATVIDDALYYYVEVTSGNTGTAFPDEIKGVSVTFDDPTPRVTP